VTPLLSAEDLTFTIEEKSLISDIHFQLNPGEMLGLVGPNGAGKSTLLRCLSGYFEPTRGSVWIDGTPLSSLTARQRAQKISYIAQENSQSFPFSVMEMLLMGAFPHLGYWQQPGREFRENAQRALSYVGLEDLSERNFIDLSGGEKQLILFARTLVQDTRILLLDEPTANLDLKHEERLLSMTRELCSEGKSAVVSIHNLDRAAEFCDRLILLDQGQQAALGTPTEIIRKPLLDRVYRTSLQVFRNEATGSLAVTPEQKHTPRSNLKIHLIGGAGSAVNLTRRLRMLGVQLSAGVAHSLDSDARLWKALGIPMVEVSPFASIDDSAAEQAEQWIAESQITVLCIFPLGISNRRNLELAQKAKKLVLLDKENSEECREFHDTQAKEIYSQLKQNALVMTEEKLIDWLKEK